MFIAIYSFKAKPGMEAEFEAAWAERTIEIRETMGSLGSRLHKAEDGTYIGYAQWPSRAVWEAGASPVDTLARRRWMAACESFATLHCLEVIEDLLAKT